MGKLLNVLLCGALVFGALWLLVSIILVDGPIYFHLLYADYPDPNRLGHLKGMTVSGAELGLKSAALVACIAGSVWLWMRTRKDSQL